MIVLGLTGSVGMGKSTAARFLRQLGVPVHDSDAAVHRLMGRGGAAVAAVAAEFPGVVKSGAVDRQTLGQKVFGDDLALKRLEAILHPLVQKDSRDFLRRMRRRRVPVVALDVPLLYETGGERRCDVVAVVSAPPLLQRARVMGRPGMTEARFRAILAKQMSDAEKRRRADVVIPSGLGKSVTRRRLAQLVRRLKERARAA